MRFYVERPASSNFASPVPATASRLSPVFSKFSVTPLSAAVAALGLSALFAAGPVFAQASAPATPASRAASNAAGTPNEAARRAAESPYRWIMINSAAPAKAKPVAAPAAAEPVATAPAASRRTRAEALEAVAAASAAAANSAAQTARAADVPAAPPAAAPVAAPAPVVVAAAPPPPPPPVVREPLPLVAVKQDQPLLSGAVLREAPNGVVKVAFTVNADGSTSDAKIASSTNRRLNSAVLSAVALWRYQPIEGPRATEVEMAFKLE